MKAKVFIGSSVEGLSVAYAIQQNLSHYAESTVWDQGFFELSKTTIESLNNALDTMDFGIFVFSNDDITLMRGTTSSTVRDNVLFEFGLFIGKLGRERVFFIIPDGTSMHLPTDLLGITPGRYDPHRQDNSLQAATGPVCNDIRNQIKKLGLFKNIEEFADTYESNEQIETPEKKWVEDFLNDNFSDAKEKLTKQMLTDEGVDLQKDEVWMAYIIFKMNEKEGLLEIANLYEKENTNSEVISLIMTILRWEKYTDLAIEYGKKALPNLEDKNKVLISLAECYADNADVNGAEEVLKSNSPTDNPDIAVALADLMENKNDALLMLNSTYKNFPTNENLVYKFAKLLSDNQYYKESLYLYNFLTSKYADNYEYHGYLGNVCIFLKLYDNAMIAYQKANDLSSGKGSWILSNIGNLYSNKGLYSEAIKSLKNSLEINDESEYAHDRLATAIKNKEEEKKKFQNECDVGRTLLRNFNLKEEKL